MLDPVLKGDKEHESIKGKCTHTCGCSLDLWFKSIISVGIIMWISTKYSYEIQKTIALCKQGNTLLHHGIMYSAPLSWGDTKLHSSIQGQRSIQLSRPILVHWLQIAMATWSKTIVTIHFKFVYSAYLKLNLSVEKQTDQWE